MHPIPLPSLVDLGLLEVAAADQLQQTRQILVDLPASLAQFRGDVQYTG
jgi:hypothetical protein